MPVILALDTSTPRVTVAVHRDGVAIGRTLAAGRRTGAALAPLVADLMADQQLSASDLDAVAVGVGPGPYTSLRVGIMYAAAVAYAQNIPVVGACTHDVIARTVPLGTEPAAGTTFTVATDARRREVYFARYDDARARIVGPMVMPAAEVRDRWPTDVWRGFGATQEVDVEAGQPDARTLATWVSQRWPLTQQQLGRVPARWDDAGGDGSGVHGVPQTLLHAEPLYLRRPDATAPAAR